jgi:hypothetical protein
MNQDDRITLAGFEVVCFETGSNDGFPDFGVALCHEITL